MYKKPDPKPVTVEATLLWKLPDKLVAMDAKGFFYIWFFKPAKQLGFSVEEGCMVYVHADETSRDVYHMAPVNAQVDASSASPQEDHE